MKKLITLLTSLTLSVSALTAIGANAIYIADLLNVGRYEKIVEFSERAAIYYNGSAYAYGSPSNACIMLEDFSKYYVTEEEAATVAEFIDENYPELDFVKYNELCEYEMVYPAELTKDEQFSIVLDIYENTGIFCIISCNEAISFHLYLLGDTDYDGAVNALDASNILTYYASGQTGSLSTYSDEDIDSMTLVGDYDGDGNVNAVDASLVLAEYAEEQTKGT